MLFKRKRRPSPTPMPPWMKWGLIGFVAFIFLTQAHNRQVAPAPENAPATPQEFNPVADITAKLPIEGYKAALSFNRAPKITDIRTGTGPLILCGQEVELRYTTLPATNESEAKTLRFRVGAEKAPVLIERGITGMHIGGVRRLNFSPPISFSELESGQPAKESDGGTLEQLDIELVSAMPEMGEMLAENAGKLGLRLYDTQGARRAASFGSPSNVICSDHIKLQLSLWDASGNRLFSNMNDEPLLVHIGEGTLPIGIEQGLIGMPVGGHRTLILPTDWQKPLQASKNSLAMKESPLHNLPLPKNQLVVVDMELVSIAAPEPVKVAPPVSVEPKEE